MENFWETAKKMESEGIAFFKKLSLETTVEELKGLFTFLANEEQNHLEIFQKLEAKQNISFSSQENSLAVAKGIFAKIQPNFSEDDKFADSSSIYKKIKTMEADAVTYYSSLLEKVENEEEAAVLKQIIKEEKRHEKLFDALIDFVSKPNQWLEDAEFNHLDNF